MNKTKIEWCYYTWNPVTGCLHDCPYCYARGIARRFEGGHEFTSEYGMDGSEWEVGEDTAETRSLHVLDSSMRKSRDDYAKAPFPFGFDPTFHRYRLDEPQRVKKPSKIFVCSMADLFGEWVPPTWISAVFDACARAPWHEYLFLTKNPKRYDGIGYDNENYEINIGVNEIAAVPPIMFGATATNNEELLVAYESQAEWLSIEPISEELYTDAYFCGSSMGLISDRRRWEWVVIGAETGNRAGKTIPRLEWIEDIVQTCRFWKTPVFMKSNLAPVWGEELIQEYPEGLK